MSKSTYAYVLNCVQGDTGQYRKVQGSTRNGTRQYRSKSVKVQGSTWRYMSVHGLHLRRAAGGGAGGGGRFRCSFESAALTAPTVASASSHCMHKLGYSSPGTLACASPATAPSFATRGQRRQRRQLAMPRQAPRQPRPQPRVAASHPDPRPHRRRWPAGGTAGVTSTCGGEAASEVTVLVVMNWVVRFLVPDVGTGDRLDDEAEDVELHHTVV